MVYKLFYLDNFSHYEIIWWRNSERKELKLKIYIFGNCFSEIFTKKITLTIIVNNFNIYVVLTVYNIFEFFYLASVFTLLCCFCRVSMICLFSSFLFDFWNKKKRFFFYFSFCKNNNFFTIFRMLINSWQKN